MVKVATIEIEINGTKVVVTVDQARELQQALGKLLGDSVQVESQPWQKWAIPCTTGTPTIQPPYIITCHGDNLSGESMKIKISNAVSDAIGRLA